MTAASQLNNGTLRVNVKGMTAMQNAARRHRYALNTSADDALFDMAQDVFLKSQALVPVDTGFLRSSGYILEEKRGTGKSYAVVYDADYAVYVHEMTHLRHDPPTSAKFVEIPLNASANKFIQIIDSRIASVRAGAL